MTRRAEAAAQAADEVAQEVGPGLSTNAPQRVAPGFLRAVSPEGHDVVFVPGEALPAWAVAKLVKAKPDSDGVLRLP